MESILKYYSLVYSCEITSFDLNFKDKKSVGIFFELLHCHEKVHDDKEFSCGNSKPCHESQITTC